MNNQLLQQYVGQFCMLSTGSLGTSVTGRIVRVEENWIEVLTKKGSELVNADYVQSIKPLAEKS